jgi:hypothetical protein
MRRYFPLYKRKYTVRKSIDNVKKIKRRVVSTIKHVIRNTKKSFKRVVHF